VHLASSLHAASDNFTPPVKDYLLYVGNRNLYKNFIFMTEALAPLLLKYPGLHLVCAGGGAFTNEEKEKFKQLNIADRVKYIFIDDTILAGLYTHARAFIFPSLYEGFGIPTIEAMGCGCPVIASNRSSVPEVGADAALYFNPSDRDEISHAVERVISDDHLQQQLSTKGYERAKAFSWYKTASETLNVYQQICNAVPV
jgi:glycosyltransferase involved in cell wall biosynthesis